MLYADVLRGDDSTGVIAVENDGGFFIAKEAVEATWFIPQIRKDRIGPAMWNRGAAMLGHNRKATVGKVTDESAHPFVVDNTFAMIHNGTLHGHKHLADTEVDSEALAKVLKVALEQEDSKAALEETLGKVFGAYAIMAFDQKTNKAHFLRNKERPLSYVETDDCWFFASEGYMLGWIVSRNGYDLNKHKIVPLPEHELMSIDLENNEVTREKLVPKKATPQHHKVTSGTVAGATTSTPDASNKSAANSTFQEGGVLSKNEFKRLRKKYIYSRQEFWALDYVEKNFPLTVEQGETELMLIGEFEDGNLDGVVNAQINISLLGIPPEDINIYFEERKWIGVVQDMVYDKRTGIITFHMSKARPTALADYKETTNETSTVAHTLH